MPHYQVKREKKTDKWDWTKLSFVVVFVFFRKRGNNIPHLFFKPSPANIAAPISGAIPSDVLKRISGVGR